MSRVVVTGGTGFVGRVLVGALLASGHAVTILTRSRAAKPPSGAQAVVWPGGRGGGGAVGEGGSVSGGAPSGRRGIGTGLPVGSWVEALDGADAVVHLAGEPIASRRWNGEQRRLIRQSRVEGTHALVSALVRARRRPRVLVSGSAAGFYGAESGDEELNEDAPAGRDFLSEVCVAWEGEARRAEELGIRVALVRTGLVLGPDGGALPRLVTPFRLFLGGPLGSGRQWMSWIHRDDLVGLICCLIERDDARGPYNAVAPHPVTNRKFSGALGLALGRPSWLAAPAPLLRIALGEMAEALLLGGQRVIPARALVLGYRFRFPELEPALGAILQTGRTGEIN